MKLSKPLRWALEALIFLLIIYGLSRWQAREMLRSDGSEVVAPMTLVTLKGEVHPLFQKGERTLVYFWAPWCRVCALSIGSLQNVESEKLRVVTVAMDFDSTESVSEFVEEHRVTAPVLLGHQQLRELFQVQGYPSYYLLDEQGNVVARSIGLNTSIGIKLNDWLSRL